MLGKPISPANRMATWKLGGSAADFLVTASVRQVAKMQANRGFDSWLGVSMVNWFEQILKTDTWPELSRDETL